MRRASFVVFVITGTVLAGTSLAQLRRDLTCFQTGGGYAPEVDIASDVAIVYGGGPDFAERAAGWRNNAYTVSLMTGIAWGGYDAYYMADGTFKKDEVQTTKSGRLYMHGDSTTVGYNVPTPAYIEFIKKYIEPAVDAGIQAVYLEEPEYWAETGWSAAFKNEWQRFYGEPWQEPDSSVDAQYRASKLKYEMYYTALREVFAHAKKRAAAQGRAIECHVPTHSLVNYAQWRIVSPESHLIDIPELDGYIAQVWTGTARSANQYRGAMKERTFETAYLEFGQMTAMACPTGKKVWFLADPVEDNPDRSWEDYKRNYECTIVASLLWPEVARYEVMPWPQRIFQGAYRAADADDKTVQQGIPSGYATEILAVINALNDMEQKDIVRGNVTSDVRVVISDTAMFQRAAPDPSNPHLGSFFGLAMPLVKHGVPLQVLQLENTLHPQCLAACRVLLLTYEGQKPLKPAYHDALTQWVKDGGGLIVVDDGRDPYNHVREWWNDQGKTDATPLDDLYVRLGATPEAQTKPQPVGKGFLRMVDQSPAVLAAESSGADKVVALVNETLAAMGRPALVARNCLQLQRGPYVIAAALDESVSEAPLCLDGPFVDLFDPRLPVIAAKKLVPGQRALLYDLAWARRNGPAAKVLAAAGRVLLETLAESRLAFSIRGPKATRGVARVLLPSEPKDVVSSPPIPVDRAWDGTSSTLWLSFDHQAAAIAFTINW